MRSYAVEFLLVVASIINVAHCQLVGSRGVISLPRGELYRDPVTVKASEAAAKFAIKHQPRIDSQARRRKDLNMDIAIKPKFYSRDNKITARYLRQDQIFGYRDTLRLSPPPEQLKNKPIQKILPAKREKSPSQQPAQYSPRVSMRPTSMRLKIENREKKTSSKTESSNFHKRYRFIIKPTISSRNQSESRSRTSDDKRWK